MLYTQLLIGKYILVSASAKCGGDSYMLLSPRPTPLEGFTLLLPYLILIEPMSQIPLTFLGYPVTIKIAKW